MKTIPLRIIGVAAAAGLLLIFSSSARAQGEDGGPQPVTSRALSARIDYGNDAIFQPEKQGIDFTQYGLQALQNVTLTVQFPVELAGQLIIAAPLDGGIITIPDEGLHVADDGTVVFAFQASDMPGACRIAVHQPDDSNVLHFWIIDTEHPENNPAELPGAY
ncbi:MAG: hypothetical protein H0X34_19420 [Chthoniobacterales bacterium]|nr:hypothetical protein [Chthoniobacterales bacterium]